MTVMVNGHTRDVPEGTTVEQLLDVLQVVPERVVVEVNLTILKRAQHLKTMLKAGDRVEIVRFIGGGSRAAPSSRPEARPAPTAASEHLLAP